MYGREKACAIKEEHIHLTYREGKFAFYKLFLQNSRFSIAGTRIVINFIALIKI
jgi:hypothetical protein